MKRQINKRTYHVLMIALICLALIGGLALPLQTEDVQAKSKAPAFAKKARMKAKMTPIKRGKKKMNLRLEGRQKVFGYDTVQGSCYGKGYVYYSLWDHSSQLCKLVKMRASDRKVVKISKTLNLTHCNDMTFNTQKNKLVVCHARPAAKKLSVVNPKTLKIEKTVTVKLPKKAAWLDRKRIKKKGGYKGFSNIAYNARHRQYVVQMYSSRDFLYLNEKFKPVRHVTPDRWDSQVYQGMDSLGNYLIVCNSFKSGKPYNVLSVYDWDGHYRSRIVLNRGEELESLYHRGSTLYVTTYKAYYAHYRWVMKEKKTRKKGRVFYYSKRYSLRSKLNRDNHLYRLSF